MKINKIRVLALTGLILVVMACGNALAYSYLGVEWSNWNGYNSVSYTSTTQGNPTTYGGFLTWQNSFVNNLQSSQIIPVLWSYTDQPSQQSALQQGPTLNYHGSWCPDGANLPVTSHGSHTLTITHQYLYPPSWWTIIFGNNAGSGSHSLPYYYAG